MPEGPEIRIVADRLHAAIAGQRIDAVDLGLERLLPFRGALEGSTVTGVTSRGKALLTGFDSGVTLYSHNQLYGRWYIRKRDQLPRTGRSLRVGLHTERTSALLYSASEIEVLDGPGLAAHPFLARLGPDILDPELTWRQVAARLNDPAFRNRRLGGLYLDQGFLAGLGNYLRSEILHFAGLQPTLRPRDLAVVERNVLARETLAVSRRSFQTRGLTNPPGRLRSLRARGATRGAMRFAVFARAGKRCYRCGGTISRIAVGSRRLYLCTGCQRG